MHHRRTFPHRDGLFMITLALIFIHFLLTHIHSHASTHAAAVTAPTSRLKLQISRLLSGVIVSCCRRCCCCCYCCQSCCLTWFIFFDIFGICYINESHFWFTFWYDFKEEATRNTNIIINAKILRKSINAVYF